MFSRAHPPKNIDSAHTLILLPVRSILIVIIQDLTLQSSNLIYGPFKHCNVFTVRLDSH
jgi:hypothetical protein